MSKGYALERMVLDFLFPWSLGSAIVAAILAVIVFLPRPRLGVVAALPGQLLASLARRFRDANYRVAEREGSLGIRLGDWAAVRIHAASTEGGSEVRFQADATPEAWGFTFASILLSPILSVPAAIISIAATLLIAARVRGFARGYLPPMLAARLPPPPTQPQDFHALLAETLAEARRLAAEAYDVERVRHRETQLVVVFTGVLVWAILVVVPFAIDPARFGPWADVLMWLAAFGAVATILPASGLVRRRLEPRIERYRVWVERLEKELSRERAGVLPQPGGASVFELIAEASRDVPAWLRSTERAPPLVDPRLPFLPGMLSVWSLLALYGGALLLASSLSVPLGVSLATAGIAGVAGAVALHLRWRKLRRTDRDDEAARWNRRFDVFRSRIDAYLRSL